MCPIWIYMLNVFGNLNDSFDMCSYTLSIPCQTYIQMINPFRRIQYNNLIRFPLQSILVAFQNIQFQAITFKQRLRHPVLEQHGLYSWLHGFQTVYEAKQVSQYRQK